MVEQPMSITGKCVLDLSSARSVLLPGFYQHESWGAVVPAASCELPQLLHSALRENAGMDIARFSDIARVQNLAAQLALLRDRFLQAGAGSSANANFCQCTACWIGPLSEAAGVPERTHRPGGDAALSTSTTPAASR